MPFAGLSVESFTELSVAFFTERFAERFAGPNLVVRP